MNHDHGVDRLHAFVDGQLDPADKARLMEEMERDAKLRSEICELHRLKEYVNLAFDAPPEAPARTPRFRMNWHALGRSAAALLLLTVGFWAGRWNGPSPEPVAPTQVRHVVFHLNESDGAKFLSVMKEAESAAQTGDAQVEIVANAGGIDLVRSDRSPYPTRVRDLMRHHTNLQFIACEISLRKQLDSSEPLLVEGTQIAPSAAEHILWRMEQGWSYVRV